METVAQHALHFVEQERREWVDIGMAASTLNVLARANPELFPVATQAEWVNAIELLVNQGLIEQCGRTVRSVPKVIKVEDKQGMLF